MIAQDLAIKTDYSGHFSIAVRPAPKDIDMGLAVPLSETEGHGSSDGGSKGGGADIPKIKRKPRGANGLTAHAKRLLVGACNWMEDQYGKENLIFHTATLPIDDPRLKKITLQKSKDILKYWRKVLSRLLKSKNLPSEDIVIVMELQKRGAIHFHSVFVNKRLGRKKYLISIEELDRAWEQALCAIIPECRACDFSKSCRSEAVRKAAGRYLAKYLSKCYSKLLNNLDFSITWYSVGNHIKQILKNLTRRAVVSVVRRFNFQAFKEILANFEVAWQMVVYSHPLYGDRSLSGFYDHRTDFISSLVKWVIEYSC